MRYAKKIQTVVITGGASAGKTRCVDCIKEYLISCGYKVLVLHEIATEILRSGIIPSDECVSRFQFEEVIFEYQLFKEKQLIQIAKTITVDKGVVIVLDRGLLDVKSYLSDKEFEELLRKYNISKEEILNRYDIVIHLESLATQIGNMYNKDSNNEVRMEDKEEAYIYNERGKKDWLSHPNMYIVEVKPTFEDKMKEVIDILRKKL